jgi:hypothetical protein
MTALVWASASGVFAADRERGGDHMPLPSAGGKTSSCLVRDPCKECRRIVGIQPGEGPSQAVAMEHPGGDPWPQ